LIGHGGILIQDYINAEVWENAVSAVLQNRFVFVELSGRAFCYANSTDFQPGQLAIN